jgi:hypothetical protein
MTAKTCTKCDELKPLDEFPRMARRSDGRGSWCKCCKNERDRARHAADPAKARQRSSRWAKDNPERKRAQSARSVRKFRDEQPERRAAQSRKDQANRRAAQRGALFGTVDWEAIRLLPVADCHICGQPLPDERTADTVEPDHLVALAAGGAHSAENLRPAHASCNASRQARPLTKTTLGAWTIRPVSCRTSASR